MSWLELFFFWMGEELERPRKSVEDLVALGGSRGEVERDQESGGLRRRGVLVEVRARGRCDGEAWALDECFGEWKVL